MKEIKIGSEIRVEGAWAIVVRNVDGKGWLVRDAKGDEFECDESLFEYVYTRTICSPLVEAKSWCCEIAANGEELEEIEEWLEIASPGMVIEKINQHYDGGWAAFEDTCNDDIAAYEGIRPMRKQWAEAKAVADSMIGA